MPGIRGNFFGRLPGPRRLGPGAKTPSQDPPPSIPIGYTGLALTQRPKMLGRQAYYRLRPPTVVSLPPSLPVRVTLSSYQKLPRRTTSYQLGSPTSVRPGPPWVARTKVTFARQIQRRLSKWILRPPIVITQAQIVVVPLGALAFQSRRRANWRLRPPTVVSQVVSNSPVVTEIRTTFAARRPRFHTLYQLKAPTVVASSPPVETVLRAYLAKTPLPARGEGYSLGAPQIVNLPPVLPLRISLALFKRPPRGTIAVLGVPTVVGPFVPPPEPPQPQTPTNFGAFIDRRERRTERREWLVTRRRGG
jgi:hypothetical protein